MEQVVVDWLAIATKYFSKHRYKQATAAALISIAASLADSAEEIVIEQTPGSSGPSKIIGIDELIPFEELKQRRTM